MSNALNSISVRQLRHPTTPMSPGGPSVFIESLLGDLGTDKLLPYWIGVAQALESGAFDHLTAMQFLDVVADYRERFPDKFARTTMWLKNWFRF
ncbi:hypothetical protein HYR99_06290 [Candidatus Poribacteria bacterium]|nr:hypothetical protein [Candidatus Poribacteria bacterium]